MNDQPLAEAISLLRGEWAERSPSTIVADSVESIDWDELPAGGSQEADVIIFPSRYLGELGSRSLLRPVRPNVLESDSYRADDVFPLVKFRLISWGGETMALPLGIDLPVLAFRAGGEGQTDLRPPATWSEYDSLVTRTQTATTEEDGQSDASPAWQPTKDWAAVLLLARALPTMHSDRTAVLFDAQSMQPRLTEPPLVRALEELRAYTSGSGLAEASSASLDPHSAAEQVWSGKSRFAIGLPPSAANDPTERHRPSNSTEEATEPITVGWAALPGALQTYNATIGQWRDLNSPQQVPILGIGDRLAAVTTSSRNVATAFQLLEWLASPEINTQIAPQGLFPVRSSLARSRRWYDDRLKSGERAQLAEVLTESLNGDDCFVIPRIPGIDEYLDVLAGAVREALDGRIEPRTALEQAAADWEEITESRGRESQRQAYLSHLGIEAE